MKSIRQARATALLQFIRHLEKGSVPTGHALREAKLPALIAKRPDAWVASRCYGQFIQQMARSQGIEDLGFRVGRDAGMDAWSPTLSDLLIRSPTLHEGLATLSAYCRRQTSHMSMWLQPHDDAVRVYHRGNIGIGLPGHDQDVWFSIQALVAIIREFAGPTWCPTEILVASRDVCGTIVSATYPECHVLCAQAIDAITIPRHLLHAPRRVLPCRNPSLAAASGIAEPARDFAGSLQQLLEPYVLDGYPNISFIAEILDCSVRGLQRRLAKCETTYSKTIERVRINAAIEAMEDSDKKLIDIAMDLGYADQSAFSRAFRRWCGVSPKAFHRTRHRSAGAWSRYAGHSVFA
jgi:AraC-like DNA-binding protein